MQRVYKTLHFLVVVGCLHTRPQRECIVILCNKSHTKFLTSLYRVSQVLPPERKHPLLINLKFSKNSGIIVYHCRTICKNFKIFNETGKDFVLIQ
jgi:hypothetical protein